MRCATLGDTGLIVSRPAFGAMTFTSGDRSLGAVYKQVTSIILGASRLAQLVDNLGAIEVELTPTEIADLDASTQPPAVYPNWFIDRMADQISAKALAER
jgi:aryl-alcohol dehydrogenase-like predicted oxidoreductase